MEFMKDRINYSKRQMIYSAYLYPSEIITVSNKESVDIITPTNIIDTAYKFVKNPNKKDKKIWITFLADSEVIDSL